MLGAPYCVSFSCIVLVSFLPPKKRQGCLPRLPRCEPLSTVAGLVWRQRYGLAGAVPYLHSLLLHACVLGGLSPQVCNGAEMALCVVSEHVATPPAMHRPAPFGVP